MGELGSPWMLVVALIAGLLIGSVGVGGVILAPALILLDGLNAHAAIVTAIWSFFFAALAGSAVYLWRNTVDLRAAALLCATIIPGAIVGALVSTAVPAIYPSAALAALVLASGCYTLLPRQAREETLAQLRPSRLLPVGAVVGVGSALLGASGPVFLVPILLVMRVPALLAVGVSQVIQLPIVILGTTTFAFAGNVNYLLGLVLGGPLAAGVAIRARAAHSVHPVMLRRIVAVALVGAGIFMAVRVLGS